MKPTERTANTASKPKAGFFATRRGLLDGKKSGASMTGGAGALSRARKMTLPGVAVLCFAAGLMALTAAPALAAAPETPGPADVEPVTPATSAFVRGNLTPGKETEPFEALTYKFLYRETKSLTECKGGGETPEAAASGEREFDEVRTTIEGLTPHTEYTVCLESINGEGTRVGPAAHFRTAIALETPETLPATAVTGYTATFHGILNPNTERKAEPGTYDFLYQASEAECGEEAGPLTHTTVTPAAGEKKESVSTEVTGLLPLTTYTFCVRVLNEEPTFDGVTGAPITFTTPAAPPAITQEPATAVTSTEATVSAEINPGGVMASYKLEYGTGSVEEHSLPEHGELSLPIGNTPDPVQLHLTGLTPGTEYHFRYVATNEPENTLDTTLGATAAFTTTAGAATSGALPDERAVELVSSAFEAGEVYVSLGPASEQSSTQDLYSLRPVRAAANGGAVAYVADPGPVGGDGSQGAAYGNSYLAVRGPRSGAQGWESSDITPPVAEGESNGEATNSAYETFSPDLSLGILESPARSVALSAQPAGPPNCDVLYSRTPDGSLHALFTSTTTPGNCVQGASSVGLLVTRFLFAGATDGGGQLFFQSPAALVAPAVESGSEGANLYASRNGVLALVNVLPGGSIAPHATFGGPSEKPSTPPDFGHAVSVDGGTVYWTDLATRHVYARVDGANTIPVSPGPAKFWTASTDGSYAFYTEGGKLWRFNVATASSEPVATSGINAGEPVGVQGVLGASEDGSVVYFVAEGVLQSGAEPRKCEAAPVGTPEYFEEERGLLPHGKGCNLYVWHAGGTLKFVTALSARDNEFANTLQPAYAQSEAGDWSPSQGMQTAQVSSDGRRLVFQSTVSLTGYDMAPLLNETKHEIYTFDLDSARLSCVSCDPSGAPPRPESGLHGVGASLPISFDNTYSKRLLSADGSRIFFDTSQPLASSDTNGVQDVYEWEQEGSGSCAVAVPSRGGGGCVSLLSAGESGGFSYLIDASASGDDVFIAHRGQLGGVGPADSKMHLYDVRVHGGFPQISTACTGTGCQGVPPAPPQFATPSSVTFSGIGNFPPIFAKAKTRTAAQLRVERLAKALEACRHKHDKHKRAACEREAQKRYGTRHTAHKATSDRSARR